MSDKKPFCTVRHQTVTIPIYRVQWRDKNGKERAAFLVKYRLHGHLKPMQVKRARLADAKAEAQRAAELIASGQSVQLQFQSGDAEAYRRAQVIAEKIGKSVELVCEEHVNLVLQMTGNGTPLQAVQFWNKHQANAAIVSKTVGEVVEEMLEAKEADKLSDCYQSDLRKRLTRFAKEFPCSIDAVLGSDLEKWLRGLKHEESTPEKPIALSPRSRNNFRSAIKTLFTFAKSRRYLPRDWDEMRDVSTTKSRIETIHIFSPDELSRLLSAANEDQLPFLVVGAFAGLRHAEIQRLRWENIRFDSAYIEVTAKSAKTGERRLVPIQPNLLEWILPYRNKNGLVCSYSNMSNQLGDLSEKSKVEWKRNALRHSFVSYRVAQTQDVAKVALEAGNSPRKIFSNYLELVTPEEATRWFNIKPAPAGAVTIQLQKTA